MSFKSQFRSEIAKLGARRKDTKVKKVTFKEPGFLCDICQIRCKTKGLLDTHIQSDEHKQKIATFRENSENSKPLELKPRKRKAEEVVEEIQEPPYFEKIENSTITAKPQLNVPIVSQKPAGIPSDVDGVPEGFFDDPQQDAKARNVPYVDKFDVLFDKFKEDIKEDLIATDQLFEQNWERSEISRDEQELNQMESCVKRMLNLREVVDQALGSQSNSGDIKVSKENENDDSSSENEYELVWRTKNPFSS